MTDATLEEATVEEPKVVVKGRRKKAKKAKRKLCIVCSKGSLDMAYPPLILANAGRMGGMEVHLFFTFWGMDIITESKKNNLHVSVVGNPNMHPSFHIPTALGVLPGMSSMASAMMRKEIANLDFPPVGEFLDNLNDAGTHIYACEMAMDMMKLKEEDLVPYAKVLGALEFLDIAEDAQVMFI